MISSLYLHSRSPAKPLRIGVMIDGFDLPNAFRQILLDIKSSDFASLELVVVNQGRREMPASAGGSLSRYLRLLKSPSRNFLLYALVRKLDQVHVPVPNPLTLADCRDILATCPRLDVPPLGRRFVHRFPEDALCALRSFDLDVLLRFGFNILRGEVLTGARYGIWSFHHGDNEFYRGGPPLFWEVVEDNPCSGVVLQVLNEKLDDGVVLCKALFSTVRGLHPGRNLFLPYWGSTHFVIRKLHELHERGWEKLNEAAIMPAPYRGRVELYRPPTNSQIVKWMLPELGTRLIEKLNPFRSKTLYHWRICLRRSTSPGLIAEPSPNPAGFQWIPSPRGHFYADPFLIEQHGQLWLFFEDYVYEKKRACIRCAPVRADLSLGPSTICLDLPHHLSYPFVFHHDGEVFMIPESAEHGSVEMWRATEFPHSWKLEKTLFRGLLADTTPLFQGGRWYFFGTIVEPIGNAIFGALFSADHLTGDWVHHPSSPISTDVRDARAAGAIQRIENRLFRPVQDCSENYGRRIHVREILELTTENYRERHLHTIEPDWEKGLQGVHTYGYCAGVEALDAFNFQDRNKVIGPK